MRQAKLLLILFFLLSCDDGDEPALIKGYEFEWENHVGLRYYIPDAIPTIEFLKIHKVDDGYIIFARSYSIWEAYIIKVSDTGEFVSEFKIRGEPVFDVLADDAGGVNVISVNFDNFFIVRKLGNDLAIQATNNFDISLSGFPKYFYLKTGILRVRDDQSKMEKFDLNGTFGWQKSLSDLSLPEGLRGLGTIPKDKDEMTLIYSHDDAVKLTHIDPETGEVHWNKSYSLANDFGGAELADNFRWMPDNKLYMTGTRTAGLQNYLSLFVLNSEGNITLTKDLDFPRNQIEYPGPILSTHDRGSIISLNADPQNDTVNFRLLKIDAKGNPGWIGTFHTNSGYDNLTGLVETSDGGLTILSYYGKVTHLAAR
jgi:hypothetical protein